MQADLSTNTFFFCYHLSYQASTCKDPNLPSYVDALTSPDQEGFYEGMWKEIK